MKLTIDFAAKIIKIEGSASLGELMDQLDKLFPHYEWREYKLVQETIYIQNSQPWTYTPGINIPDLTIPYNPNPVYPGTTAPYGPIADWQITNCDSNGIVTIDVSNGVDITLATNMIFAETPGDLQEIVKRK